MVGRCKQLSDFSLKVLPLPKHTSRYEKLNLSFTVVSDREVSDAVEVHGQMLMIHASATCSGVMRQARVIKLPFVVDK